MKVLVCVKRVLDPQVKARVKADGSGVDLANAKICLLYTSDAADDDYTV